MLLVLVALLLALTVYRGETKVGGERVSKHSTAEISTSPVASIKNFAEHASLSIRSYLFESIGISAYLMPLFLFYAASLIFLDGRARRTSKLVTLPLLFLSLTALLSAFPLSTFAFIGAPSAGGKLGAYTCQTLGGFMGKWGASLVILLSTVLSFMTSFGISIGICGKWAARRVCLVLSLLAKSVYKISVLLLLGFKRSLQNRTEEAFEIKNDFEIAPATGPDIRETGSPQPIRARRRVLEQKPLQKKLSIKAGPASFKLPPLDLIEDQKGRNNLTLDRNSLLKKAEILEKKLGEFGVAGKVISIQPGPLITTFEFEPAPGIKINKIVSLADDLALAMSALSVRIVAPIPGRAAVGIELPNDKRSVVLLKEIIASREYRESDAKLPIALGKDVTGVPVVADLASMPHLLIAGATGTGKSVALNSMIISLLYRCHPDYLRFVMIDPKRLELSHYDGIPYLLHPVVTNAKHAPAVLKGMVREMEKRYKVLAAAGVKDISRYNSLVQRDPLTLADSLSLVEEVDIFGENGLPEQIPYVAVVIDELADLMMVASKSVEESICRLAQMARAAGIHLIVATQRPSVDVVTGIIKANFPARISFKVSSKVDSRTILDVQGAEQLLGKGDMLFLPPGTSAVRRVHGSYVSETAIARVIKHIKNQPYDARTLRLPLKTEEKEEGLPVVDADDEYYQAALDLILKYRQASISFIQRHLRIGYNRAARIIEKMEQEGIISRADGSKPRKILIKGGSDD